MTEQEQEAFNNYRRNRMIAKNSNILGSKEAMERMTLKEDKESLIHPSKIIQKSRSIGTTETTYLERLWEEILKNKATTDFKRIKLVSDLEKVEKYFKQNQNLAESCQPATPFESRKDTGKHYRFQYTVVVSSQDMWNGELTINLDPFRIADIYGITNFAQQTALKKVLCAGNRGHKDLLQDIDDIITALERWKQMLHEDELLVKAKQSPRISEQNNEKPDTTSNGGWMCYE